MPENVFESSEHAKMVAVIWRARRFPLGVESWYKSPVMVAFDLAGIQRPFFYEEYKVQGRTKVCRKTIDACGYDSGYSRFCRYLTKEELELLEEA